MHKLENAKVETIRGDDLDLSQCKPLMVGFTILFHPDITRIGEIAPLVRWSSNDKFELSRLEPVFQTPFGEKTDSLNSPFISRTPICFQADKDGSVTFTRSDNIGLTVNDAPALSEQRFHERDLWQGVVLVLGDAVTLLLHLQDPGIERHRDDLGLIGRNAKMERLRSNILKVADLDTGVLIRGESGTGKELVAAAIRARSRRAHAAFETVNVAEIPASIAEREFFGAAKHAGTLEPGHDGYFLRADKGTLFLDEIGDIDPAVQPKLLRALETSEIQILGGNKKVKVDVRILAGTDMDLEQAVNSFRFKSSLLQRLAEYLIVIPPLSERRDDIGLLFIHFFKEALRTIGELDKLSEPLPGKRHFLPAEFIAKLAMQEWPGNVRELRHAAFQTAITNRGSEVFQAHDSIALTPSAHKVTAKQPHDAAPVDADPLRSDALESLSSEELIETLRANDFNIAKAARALNVERTKFYRRLKDRDINLEILRESKKSSD
jgi:two-component system nitrogen regulation response regulator GlnG